MEVKERQKQLSMYQKQIKKFAKQEKPEELKRTKQEYIRLLLTPARRELFQREEDMIRELRKKIRDKENQFIELKLDLCYDLHSEMESFDVYETDLNSLKKQLEKLLSSKKQRELLLEETKKEQEKQRKVLLDSYTYLELEDKKTSYQEFMKQTKQMANPTRKVIAYEIENKELEYRLTQLYAPWIDLTFTG
jgi:hypothetical protein